MRTALEDLARQASTLVEKDPQRAAEALADAWRGMEELGGWDREGCHRLGAALGVDGTMWSLLTLISFAEVALAEQAATIRRMRAQDEPSVSSQPGYPPAAEPTTASSPGIPGSAVHATQTAAARQAAPGTRPENARPHVPTWPGYSFLRVDRQREQEAADREAWIAGIRERLGLVEGEPQMAGHQALTSTECSNDPGRRALGRKALRIASEMGKQVQRACRDPQCTDPAHLYVVSDPITCASTDED